MNKTQKVKTIKYYKTVLEYTKNKNHREYIIQMIDCLINESKQPHESLCFKVERIN